MYFFIFMVGIIGYSSIKIMDESADNLYNRRLMSVQVLSENIAETRRVGMDILQTMLYEQDKNLQKQKYDDIQKSNDIFQKNIQVYRSLETDTTELQMLDKVTSEWNDYIAGVKELAQFSMNNNIQLNNIMNQLKDLNEKFKVKIGRAHV